MPLPIVGLNSKLFHNSGAYRRQPAMSIAGARLLVRKLLRIQAQGKALPEWLRHERLNGECCQDSR